MQYNHTDRYQRYLETVLEVADEYQEAGDLLARHTTLRATNADLKEHQRKWVLCESEMHTI